MKEWGKSVRVSKKPTDTIWDDFKLVNITIDEKSLKHSSCKNIVKFTIRISEKIKMNKRRQKKFEEDCRLYGFHQAYKFLKWELEDKELKRIEKRRKDKEKRK